MRKIELGLLLSLPFWMYITIFQLPYAVWTFPLTQNWFTDNGLVIFKDVIYHHTPLTLFFFYAMSKIFGNGAFMLQISSFLLSILLAIGIYLLGKQISKKVGVISLFIFLLTFPPMFNNFNAEEMAASICTLFAVYFSILFFKSKTSLSLFLTGICIGLAFMAKQAAVGIFPAIGIATLLNMKNHPGTPLVRRGIVFFIAGVFLVIIPILFYFFINNALDDFLYWNIIFNLTIYPSQSAPFGLGEGLLMSGWLFLSILGGIVLLLTEKLSYSVRIITIFMILATLLLSPSLLPSFHAYKILLFYPYPIILWSILLISRHSFFNILILLLGFTLFFPIAKSFYIDYVPQNIFQNNYILEYGDNELKVVEWIKKNTGKNEKIMNLGHHYITTLAKRLPANKYVYIFPWLIMPYNVSTREILASHPRVVIIDEQVLIDWPTLNKWRFINYVKVNYKKIISYGTYEIYTLE